jgi:hypothetical protein
MANNGKKGVAKIKQPAQAVNTAKVGAHKTAERAPRRACREEAKDKEDSEASTEGEQDSDGFEAGADALADAEKSSSDDEVAGPTQPTGRQPSSVPDVAKKRTGSSKSQRKKREEVLRQKREETAPEATYVSSGPQELTKTHTHHKSIMARLKGKARKMIKDKIWLVESLTFDGQDLAQIEEFIGKHAAIEDVTFGSLWEAYEQFMKSQ